VNGVKMTPAGVMDMPKQRASAAVTTLAGGGAALLLASAAGNAVSYAFGLFVARSLGAEQFGLYALGLTLFNVLALFAPLALDVGVIKFVSGQLTAGETGRARRTIVSAGVFAAASGLLAGIGLALFSPWLSSSLYHKPALSGVLWWFAAALPFAALTTVLLGGLQALQTVRYTVGIRYIWEPAGKFVLVALAVALGFGLSGVLGGIVIVLAVSALIALSCVMRLIPSKGSRPGEEAGDAVAFRALLAFSGPLVVSNLFGVLAPRSDMLILGYWVDAQQVGIYNAAFQTSAIIALVLGALDTAVAPIAGSLISREDHGSLKNLYHVTSRWALTLTAPVFVLMVVWGRDILALFGPAFTLGATCLLLLAAAQWVNAAAGATSSVILMSGRSRMIMMNSLGVGVLLIGANLALIPRYGILGAAIASSLSQIVVSLVRVAQVWHLQRIRPFSPGMMKPVAAAVVATAAGWIMKGEISGGPIAQLLLALCVLGIFGGTLVVFGFDPDDAATASGLWKKLAMRRS
jgi:O-antigen/teichoic acid export membrane protein